MTNDGSDTPQPFNWGLAPRDPAVIAAEQEAAARAAEQQAAAIKAAEAARAARGGQPTAPFVRPAKPSQPVQPAQPAEPATSQDADDPFAIFTPPPTSQAPAPPPAAPPLIEPAAPVVPPVFSWQVGADASPPATDENRQATPTSDPAPAPAEAEPNAWDVPTVATPYLDIPTEPHEVNPPVPTYPWEEHYAEKEAAEAAQAADEQPVTQAFSAQDLADAVSPNAAPSSGEPLPVDGAPTSAIDKLFSDTQFVEYQDEPLLGQLPLAPRTTTETTVEKLPHLPLTPTQRVLIWVAGGLVALLVLVALFFFGRTLAQPEAAPVETPAPVETTEPETPDVPALGPVAPGVYAFDELLGTECITPYTSPWEEEYTVVACDEPHLAQMVAVGAFDDAADEAYPGGEELDSRINQLCTSNEIIDYDAAGEFDDIQIAGSYPATAEAWDAGDRTYYCFVTRESGDTLTTSIANEPVAAETDAE